jgi:hypothetical protein
MSSSFPKRLIEEPGAGAARRLLESARADAPPPELVASAIASASRAAHAQPRSGWRLKAVAAGSGLLVIAAALTWSARTPPPPLPSAAVAAPGPLASADAPAAAPELSVPVTTIAELPNAPAAPAPLLVASAPAPARPAAASVDLLREANRLRGAGKWAEAATTYRKVLDAGGAEAYPAEVALANLELQRGETDHALSHYQHALAAQPTGALAEEARWGKARALRAAARSGEERAALQDFRAHHADSPLSSLVARRLAELGASE